MRTSSVKRKRGEQGCCRRVPQRGRYQEGLIGALAEGGVVGTVHWRLAGELGVKLTHVFGGLLRRRTTKQVSRSEYVSSAHVELGLNPTGQTFPAGLVLASSSSICQTIGIQPSSCRDTHQEGFERRLHFASQQVVPVDVSEEGMSLRGTRRSDCISSSGLCSEESDCPLVANMRLLHFILVDAFVAAFIVHDVLLEALMLRRNLVDENNFLIFMFF